MYSNVHGSVDHLEQSALVKQIMYSKDKNGNYINLSLRKAVDSRIPLTNIAKGVNFQNWHIQNPYAHIFDESHLLSTHKLI